MREEKQEEQIEPSQPVIENKEPKKASKFIKILMVLLTCFFIAMTIYAFISLAADKRPNSPSSNNVEKVLK